MSLQSGFEMCNTIIWNMIIWRGKGSRGKGCDWADRVERVRDA